MGSAVVSDDFHIQMCPIITSHIGGRPSSISGPLVSDTESLKLFLGAEYAATSRLWLRTCYDGTNPFSCWSSRMSNNATVQRTWVHCIEPHSLYATALRTLGVEDCCKDARHQCDTEPRVPLRSLRREDRSDRIWCLVQGAARCMPIARSLMGRTMMLRPPYRVGILGFCIHCSLLS